MVKKSCRQKTVEDQNCLCSLATCLTVQDFEFGPEIVCVIGEVIRQNIHECLRYP